jgi:hypothetical protein
MIISKDFLFMVWLYAHCSHQTRVRKGSGLSFSVLARMFWGFDSPFPFPRFLHKKRKKQSGKGLKRIKRGNPGFIYSCTLPKYVLTGFTAIHTSFFGLHYQWKHTFGQWKWYFYRWKRTFRYSRLSPNFFFICFQMREGWGSYTINRCPYMDGRRSYMNGMPPYSVEKGSAPCGNGSVPCGKRVRDP